MAKEKIKKMGLSTTKRHFGVVLENIDSKLDLVVEGHKALDVKIDKNHEEFREFKKEVGYKFKVITEILASHTEMIGSIATDVEIIKSDVEFIKNSLKKKIDIDEFAVLERRVALLEKKLQRI